MRNPILHKDLNKISTGPQDASRQGVQAVESAIAPLDSASSPHGDNFKSATFPQVKRGSGRLALGLVTATKGSTQKRILYRDSKALKDDKHKLNIWAGHIENVYVDGLEGFKSLVEGLASNQAVVLGNAADDRRYRLLTDKQLKKEKAAGTAGDAIARTKECLSWPQGDHLLMLDHDPEPNKPDITALELWERAIAVIPELAGVGRLSTPSTSSGIYRKETGECLRPENGHHTYIQVRGNVERFVEILKTLCWLKGEAFYKLGVPNAETQTQSILERFLVDAAVFSPERLIYEAGALLPNELEQRRSAPHVVEGGVLDLDAIPSPTAEEKHQADENKKNARRKAEARQLKKATRAIAATGHPHPKREAKRRIALCNSNKLEPQHTLHIHKGSTLRVKDIGPEHDGLLLCDPQEPNYRNGAQVARLYWNDGHWAINSFGYGGTVYTAASVVDLATNPTTKQFDTRSSDEETDRVATAQETEVLDTQIKAAMSRALALYPSSSEVMPLAQPKEAPPVDLGDTDVLVEPDLTRTSYNGLPIEPTQLEDYRWMKNGDKQVLVVRTAGQAIAHLRKQGKKLSVDARFAGAGKTTMVSQLTPHSIRALDELGHSEVTKVLAVLPDLLNVSNDELKQWPILQGRHNGNVKDTETGRISRATWDTPNDVKVADSNCHLASVSHILNESNPAYSGSSVACFACTHADKCSGSQGIGWGAKYESKKTWNSDRIRTNYARLKGIISGDELSNLEHTFLVLDEPSTHGKLTKSIEIGQADLDRIAARASDNVAEIERELQKVVTTLKEHKAERAKESDELKRDILDTAIYEAGQEQYRLEKQRREAEDFRDSLRPFLNWMTHARYNELPGADKYHGIVLNDMFDKLKELTDGISIGQAEAFDDGSQLLAEFGQQGRIGFSQQDWWRLSALQQRDKFGKEKAQRLAELEAIEANLVEELDKSQSKELQQIRSKELTEKERAELDDLKQRRKEMRGKTLAPHEAMELAQKAEKRWLSDLLGILRGEPGHIAIAHGRITLTQPDTYLPEAINRADSTLITDASESRDKRVLARKYGVEPGNIGIYTNLPPEEKVTLIQVTGLGKMGRNRGEGCEERKSQLVSTLKRLDASHQHFDHAHYSHDARVFLDGIGSNKFKDCTSLSTAPPRPSMAGLLADYCCIEGDRAGYSDPGFQAYYKSAYREITMQWMRRLRAHLKPDVAHKLYILCDDELPIAPDETVRAGELCLEAETKGDRALRSMVEAAIWVADQGQKLTQVAIAQATKIIGANNGRGYCQQYVSKVRDKLDVLLDQKARARAKHLLLLTLNRHTKKSSRKPETKAQLEEQAKTLEQILAHSDTAEATKGLYQRLLVELSLKEFKNIAPFLSNGAIAAIQYLLLALVGPDFCMEARRICESPA